MNKYLIQTYFLKNKDKQKIALPLFMHNLTEGRYKVSEMGDSNKNVLVPSKYFETDQHLLTDFYKSIF